MKENTLRDVKDVKELIEFIETKLEPTLVKKFKSLESREQQKVAQNILEKFSSQDEFKLRTYCDWYIRRATSNDS